MTIPIHPRDLSYRDSSSQSWKIALEGCANVMVDTISRDLPFQTWLAIGNGSCAGGGSGKSVCASRRVVVFELPHSAVRCA